MRQAVILAAGSGLRIRPVSNGTPKCLLPVGGQTLLEHHITVLNDVGIDQICVVVGYGAQHIQALVGQTCHCIHNARYAETNSLYSLLLTREWVKGPFVLMNGDVLAHPDIYHRVLSMGGSALAYDSSSGHDSEHMKVRLQHRLVHGLGKDLPPEQSCGENVGILQFDRDAASPLFDAADSVIAERGERCWAPAAVDRLAQSRPIRAVDICGLPWTEIDFPEDLSNAQSVIWPTILHGQWVIGGSGRPEANWKRAS